MKSKNFILFFRWIAILEGLSFIVLLFVAMPLKYVFNLPQFVQIIGMAHGLLFITYMVQVIFAKVELNWSTKTSIILALASVLPFGTFYADKKYLKEAGLKEA